MSVSLHSEAHLQLYPEMSAAQPTGVARLLLSAATLHPRAGIGFITGKDSDGMQLLSHPQLLHEAQSILGGLRARGCVPGTNVVLLLEHAQDFLPAWWACVLGGCIPCPLTPTHSDPARLARHLAHVEELLDGPVMVATQSLLQRLAELSAVDLDELRAAVPATRFHEAALQDPAALMLTSGSTGNAKAVVLTHGNLLASMAGKQQRQQMSASDVTLNWISFDHVAALLEVHLVSLYVGATQLHLDPAPILADPLLFLRLIDRHRVSLTFSPNFLLGQINAVLQSPAAGHPGDKPLALDLSCVRYIVSGGEANVVTTGQRFLQLLAQYGLPHTALRPAFGMTETCAGSIYSAHFPNCDMGKEFASVGEPLCGLEMRIVDEAGNPTQPGEPGELQLRGTMVFGEYYNNEEATRAAFSADGWFRTGDLGRIDRSRLSLVGRNKDSIIVSGVNYFSHELETTIEPLDGIERSFVAAFPTRPEGANTEQLVIAFATSIPIEEEARLYRLSVAVRNTTIGLWGFRPALVLPLPKGLFPKTSLGKIQRSLLRKQLEAGNLAAHVEYIEGVAARQRSAHVAPEGSAETTVVEILAQVLGIDSKCLGATTSFFDLGGTSLDIFKLKCALEKRFDLADVPLTLILQNSTIRALAARITADSREGHGQYDPLVPLQPGGSKTPLFCIHPGTGEILGFVALASYFSNERPVFALRARGFNPGEHHFASFEEMVTTYVEAIRRHQPHGPYALAGYSFGAAVAFEVAKALETRGEPVAFIGCIDGTPHIGDPSSPLDFISSTVVVSFFLALIDRRQMLELPARIRAAGEEPCAFIMRLAPPDRVAQLNLDITGFRAWAELAFSLVRIGEAYNPTGTVESTTVFYAEPLQGTKQQWLNIHLRRWDRFTRASTRYVEVPGEHNSLLGPKHVAAFQALLRAEIDRALHE